MNHEPYPNTMPGGHAPSTGGAAVSVRDSRITLAHGGGGKAMRDLIEDVFVGRSTSRRLNPLEDQARLDLRDLAAQGDRLAFTTDSYVVTPVLSRRRHRHARRSTARSTISQWRRASAVPHLRRRYWRKA